MLALENRKNTRFFLSVALLLFSLTANVSARDFASEPVRIALDDLPGIDMLNVLIALEHARERGATFEISYMQSEGLAAQAVTSGFADIGMGTPYQLIQRQGAPLRMFFQLSLLRFFPVVNADHMDTWKDLDGEVMYTHGPGSGTEAVMNMLARRNGIRYREMKYIPGSGVRARAMLKNQIKATVVDTERRNMLVNSDRGNFKVLPMTELLASDEALYASRDFLAARPDMTKILIEELLNVWHQINTDPGYVARQREKYNLLPDLEPSRVDEIIPYYSEMVAESAFPMDGGLASAFDADIRFYSYAGTIEGNPSELKEEDYWDFSLLRSVIQQNTR